MHITISSEGGGVLLAIFGGGVWLGSPKSCPYFSPKHVIFRFPFSDQVPVHQRPDNFIQWISHYPTVSICAKISVFPRVQANMHTLTTAKFGSVRKP